MTDKEKIRAEIERLLDVIAETKVDTPDRLIMASSQVKILLDLKKFIDSLPEEPISENLEKVAVKAFKQIVDSDKNNFLEIFKAGANWQKQQEDNQDYE